MLTIKQMREKIAANNERLQQLADKCEAEKRERNEAENAEYRSLIADNEKMYRESIALMLPTGKEATASMNDFAKVLRENAAAGRQSKITVEREAIKVSDVNGGGLVSVNLQDAIGPLVEGVICSKVGILMPTGLAGDYVWPVYEAVTATIADEGVALTDTTIPLSKLSAKPQRVGLAIPVTRESLNQSKGLIEKIIREILPLAVLQLINKALFSPTKLSATTPLVGPFAGIESKDYFSLSTEPTYKELVRMKGKILGKGVDGAHLCYVMTQDMKAILEATSRDAGSGLMICDNDKIAGVPVYASNYITEGFIGLGDWRYQPMGLFGELSFIVDPYSQARKNAVDFVLNANYGTTTLRKEAFLLGKCAAAASASTGPGTSSSTTTDGQ